MSPESPEHMTYAMPTFLQTRVHTTGLAIVLSSKIHYSPSCRHEENVKRLRRCQVQKLRSDGDGNRSAGCLERGGELLVHTKIQRCPAIAFLALGFRV